MSAKTPIFKGVSLEELAEILSVHPDTIKKHVPDRFKLKIGKSARYDLYGVVEYFRCKQDTHEKLINDILD